MPFVPRTHKARGAEGPIEINMDKKMLIEHIVYELKGLTKSCAIVCQRCQPGFVSTAQQGTHSDRGPNQSPGFESIDFENLFGCLYGLFALHIEHLASAVGEGLHL